MIKNKKKSAPWTHVKDDFHEEESVSTFFEKELQKNNQTEFRTEKSTKKKFKKLHVKWERYDNSRNSRIDKKISYYKMRY